MKTSDFNYELPPELIAQTPIPQRDASRLLVLDKNTGAWQHRHFYDLPEYLRPGDCLILNNSRVLPARLLGHRLPGGGACEVLLLIDRGNKTWECLVRPGKRMRTGAKLSFGDGELTAEVVEELPGGNRLVRFDYEGIFLEVLDRAQAALVRDLDRAYICRSGDTHYRIPIANILYFVSDRRQVACVTAGREYTFYGKLDTVAAEVGADFVRIHQRYLVRTGAVDRMEGGEVVLRDGRRLPVSRSCQPSALLAFTRAELEG